VDLRPSVSRGGFKHVCRHGDGVLEPNIDRFDMTAEP